MSNNVLYITRRANLRIILEAFRTKAEFAKAADISPAQVSQLCSDKIEKYKIGSEVAKKIEKAASKPDGWLDVDREDVKTELMNLDVIISTVSTVNKVLKRHDMTPCQLTDLAYEQILRDTIAASVAVGKVDIDKVQHSLFNSLLSKSTH